MKTQTDLEHKASWNIDRAGINGVMLTLAAWQPYPEWQPSYEIGYRYCGAFWLIQFRMPHMKAWDIAKRLTAKGRYAASIQAVLNRLERG